MFSDPDGPVADIIREATERVGEAAKAMAPVSPRGSRYSPPGKLKAGTGAEADLRTDAESVYGRVNTPSYPYDFIKGTTQNANRIDGVVKHYGHRDVDKPFLTEALFAASSLWDALCRELSETLSSILGRPILVSFSAIHKRLSPPLPKVLVAA
jgi:hypothetical protein